MNKDKKSSYYDAGGVSVIDVIQAKLSHEEFKGFLKGNAIKYSLRMGFKGDEKRDSEKCARYSTWLKEHITNELG